MGAEYNDRFDVLSSVGNFILNATVGVAKGIGDMAVTVVTQPKSFVIATAAETVATLWNTLTPQRLEIDTENLIRSLDADAGKLFSTNPDSIHLASMIAGAVVPGGIGMKALGMARSGRLALGYGEAAIGASVVGSRQRALTREIDAIFRTAGADGAEYKKLTRQMFAADVSKNVADNIVLEAAVALGMNAHPWMEDYWDDPLKNFALGALVGGVLGAGFAIPGVKSQLRKITGPIETGWNVEILESGVKFVHPGFTNVARAQAHSRNVVILEGMASDVGIAAPLRDRVNSILISEREASALAFQRAAPWMEDAKTPQELKDQVIKLMQDPMFIGVDQIRIFNMDKVTSQTPLKIEIGKHISEDLLKRSGEAATVVVRLGSGDVFSIKGVRNAALGADLTDIASILAAEAKKTSVDINLISPVKDWSDVGLYRGKSSAQQNADFLKELALNASIFRKQLDYMGVAPDHLPRLNALIAYAEKLSPTEQAKFKVRITNEYPKYQAQREFAEKTVRPDYWSHLDNLVRQSKVLDEYTPESEFIREWVAAGHDQTPRAQMRRAFDAFFRNVPPPKGEEGNVAIAQKIWENGEGLRKAIGRTAADANGNVYLYRGLSQEPVGHSAVESYTNNPNVAGGVFTKNGMPELFEVPVENIITAFPLEMSISINRRERFHEFLVGPPTHRRVNDVPFETRTPKAVNIAPVDEKVNLAELKKIYAESTEQQIKDLDNSGKFSPEEISSRLGVTKDGVMHVLGKGKLANMEAEWRMYTTADDIPKYIGPQNQLVALTGNPNRNHMAHAYSDLDIHQQRAQMMLETEQLTRSSLSIIGNSLLDMLGSGFGIKLDLDNIHRNLAQIGNAMVDKTTVQSADQALRALKSNASIVGVGKLYINTVDRLRKEIIEPLAMPFVGLRNNPTQLAEMNGVINKLYSLHGWRDIVEDPLSGKWVLVDKGGAQGEVRFITHDNGDTFYIHQPEVANALNAMREPSKQLLYMHNLNRKLRGQAPLNDLGFYIPPVNLVNRNYAFVIDYSGGKGTQLLIANNAAELEQQIIGWNKTHPLAAGQKIVRKGEQDAENLARNYHGGDMYVTYANVAEAHTGASTLANLPSDTRLLENILQGYETSIIQGGRSFASHYMRDTIDWLDHLSAFYQRNVKDQPKTGLKQETVQDAAMAVKNILLGQDQLGNHIPLKHANNFTEFLINSAGTAVDATWNTFKKTEIGTREYFDKLNRDLAAVGVDKPLFESYDAYVASTVREARNVAPGLVSAGNGIVATMGLRFLEVGNAALNIMSLPIMTWGALMEKLPGTPIGNGASFKSPIRVMMDGIRHMFSPQGRAVEKQLWEPNGLIDQVLRQFEDTTVNLKRAGMGGGATELATEALHNITNNKGFIGLLSTPSDWAEKFTRRFAMHTGYVAAKHAYPGIDDMGATIAAMHFADRTVGNYHAAQRPTIFQGTLGAAAGLYQTYMLTFAQHIYRGIENKNFKQLSTLMLTQAGMFGLKGLPGYNLLSEQVVSQFSNNNWDLTTGTYRAVGDSAAEMILYGLPSSITGTAFYTRGDITPRVPGTVTDLALLNAVRQGFEFTTNIISKVSQAQKDGHIARGYLEALSLQSLNRPIARISEIVLGTSQTSQGNTVSSADQVWTPWGVTSRLMSARPLEEQVTRDAIHLNKFYEQRDFENRQQTMERIKMALRSGDLSDGVLSSAANDYIKNGGTSKGWRAAMNHAMINSDQGMRMDLVRKLEPGNPLHRMIDDLY